MTLKRFTLLHNHPHMKALYELIDIMYKMDISFSPNRIEIQGQTYDLLDCDTIDYPIDQFPPSTDFTLSYLKEFP